MVIIIRIGGDCNQFGGKYEKINMEKNNSLFRERVLKPIYTAENWDMECRKYSMDADRDGRRRI